MTLHWRRADDYHQETECGRFRVSGARVGERFRYLAWRCRGDRPAELIGDGDSAQEAQAHAQRHAAEEDGGE